MSRYRLREQLIRLIAGPRGRRNPVDDRRLCRQHWEASNDFRFEAIELERLFAVHLAELILLLLAHGGRGKVFGCRRNRLNCKQGRCCVDLGVEHDALPEHIRVLALRGEAHRISCSKYGNASIELLEMDNLRRGTGPLGYRIRNEVGLVRTAGCRETRGPGSLGPQHRQGAADK